MNSEKTNSSVVSARISDDVNKLLEEISENQGVSVSNMIAKILTRYTTWVHPRLNRGDLLVTRKLLTTIFDNLDTNNFDQIVEQQTNETKTLISFTYGKFDLDSLTDYMKKWFHQNNIEFSVTYNEVVYEVMCMHDMGKNFSKVILSVYVNLLKLLKFNHPELLSDSETFTLSFKK